MQPYSCKISSQTNYRVHARACIYIYTFVYMYIYLYLLIYTILYLFIGKNMSKSIEKFQIKPRLHK